RLPATDRREDPDVRVEVRAGEPVPFAPLHERAERDGGGGSRPRRLLGRRGLGDPPAALVDVAPPRAVVDLLTHRVAVLAVVGKVDPQVALTADDLDRGVVQLLRVGGLVDALALDAAAVELDEVVGARKAPGVAGPDAGRHQADASSA